MRCDANGECVYLLTHVDDIAAFAKDETLLTHALNELKRKFAIRDDGKLTYYLGVNVDWHDNGDIYMHQTAYAERVCTRFAEHMHAKHTDTPHKPGPDGRLDEGMAAQSQNEIDAMKDVPYAEVVGALGYLVTCTRPDLAYINATLARYLANPGPQHWCAAQRVLKYVQGTKNYGITY